MKAHRVTLVDDDPDSLFLLYRILSRLYPKSSIATFSNAEDALAHILNTGTEFLITGQFMRQMSGTELILQLRLRNCTIPILMISASPPVECQAREVGATEFLAKNSDPKVLEAHIRALFDVPPNKTLKSSLRTLRPRSLRPRRPTRKLR